MSAQSIISRYNHMNGNAVSGATLREFHDSIQKYLDRSGTGPFTHAINGIRKRLAAVLNSVKTNDVVEVRVKTISIDGLGKIAKEEPLRTKQLRAMFARLNNGGENLKKDKPKKKEIEVKPAPKKTDKQLKRESFKPRSRGKLSTPERKQLDDFMNDINKETARRAYYWTSFNPERRGDHFREDYAQTLVNFISEIKPIAEKYGKLDEFKVDFEHYRNKMKGLATAYLHSHSNVASAAITGPAKFPTERNRKKSDWADNKLKEYFGYDKYKRDKLKFKYLPDSMKPIKTGQSNALELLEAKLAEAKKSHEFMKAANKIIRSKKNVRERLRDELKMDDSKINKILTPDFANRTGYAQFYLTNNNANIKRLEQRVREVKKLNEKRTEGNATKQEFKGGHVVENYQENRLQLIFDGKPDEATRSMLKKHGFKWSPKNTAWQRQLTNNAKWVLTRYVLPELIKSEQIAGFEPKGGETSSETDYRIKSGGPSKSRAKSAQKKEALREKVKAKIGWKPPKNLSMKEITKATGINGVVDAQTLAGISYSTFDLAPEWKKEFHKINSDSVLMIWGKPGSGKTVKLLKLAQHLSADLNKKVLYVAEEEYGRSTLADKLTEHKIGNGNLSFAPDLDEGIVRNFDAVFLDSVNSMHLSPADVKNLIRKYPGKCWVLIVQTTKEGDFRGGRDWEHLVDIAGEVVNRKMILRKNRLDPNNKAKADKLLVEEIVTEKKQAQEIKDLVKQKIEGEQKQQAA